MDINAANLVSMQRIFTTAFQDGLAWKPPVDIGFMRSEFPSSTAGNFYAWMEHTPTFREWLGDRVFNNLRSQKFEVLNRDWEKSERMPAKDIEDDQWGVYAPIIQMHGAAWQQLLHDLVVAVLTGNATCFDGKAICADDHSYGGNTLDNLVTDALSKTSFEAAFTAGAEWKFSNGVLVSPQWTHLVHGPKLHATAHGIVDAQFIVSGNSQVDNPNYKRCQRLELPDLAGTYDDYWFLLDCSKPIKPVGLQIRKRPVPLMDTDPSHVARTGNYDWMSDGRAAAAPTFPHMIYGGIL